MNRHFASYWEGIPTVFTTPSNEASWSAATYVLKMFHTVDLLR